MSTLILAAIMRGHFAIFDPSCLLQCGPQFCGGRRVGLFDQRKPIDETGADGSDRRPEIELGRRGIGGDPSLSSSGVNSMRHEATLSSPDLHGERDASHWINERGEKSGQPPFTDYQLKLVARA